MPEELEHLLEAMPKIAEAVNKLPPELQSRAFEELLASLRGERPPTPTRGDGANDAPIEPSMKSDEDATEPLALPKEAQRNKPAKTAGKRTPRKSRSPVRDIDFRPADEVSLADLVARSSPRQMIRRICLPCTGLSRYRRCPQSASATSLPPTRPPIGVNPHTRTPPFEIRHSATIG